MPGWRIVDEIVAGETWAAVAKHRPVAALDRTPLAERTTIGFWLSTDRNASGGRFPSDG